MAPESVLSPQHSIVQATSSRFKIASKRYSLHPSILPVLEERSQNEDEGGRWEEGREGSCQTRDLPKFGRLIPSEGLGSSPTSNPVYFSRQSGRSQV